MGILPKNAEAVVIGSGAMGGACAYYLSKFGVKDILVIEQNSYLGGHSTSRCAGGVRHQFGRAVNIELSKKNKALLDIFFEEHNCKVEFEDIGYMFVVEEEKDISYFKESMILQNQNGINSVWLEEREVYSKLPFLNKIDFKGGVFYQGDGLLDAGSVVGHYIRAAVDNGVKFCLNTKLKGIFVKDGEIKGVKTDKGEISSKIVINAAGPWAPKICGMIGERVPVSVVKQQLLVTERVENLNTNFPVVVFTGSGLGLHPEGGGILTGLHRNVNEKREVPGVNIEWEQEHCRLLLKYFPTLAETKIQSHWFGYYDCTPDEKPIVGEITGIKGFYCIFGFNGHGFMHSAICGCALAEQIYYGESKTISIDDFNIRRFKTTEQKGKELYKV